MVSTLEKFLKREAGKELLPMQLEDGYRTYADIEDLQAAFAFRPHTTIEEGLRKFVEWYAAYYHAAI